MVDDNKKTDRERRFADLPSHVQDFLLGLDKEEVATLLGFVAWWRAASLMGRTFAWLAGLATAAAVGAWGVFEVWIKFVTHIRKVG